MTTTIAPETPDLLGALKDAQSRARQRDDARMGHIDNARGRAGFAAHLATLAPSVAARTLASAVCDDNAPPWLAKARVGRLLCAVPKIGTTKAARLADQSGVELDARLADLSAGQRDALAGQLQAFAQHVNDTPRAARNTTNADQIAAALARANARRCARAALLDAIRRQPGRDAGCEAAARLLATPRGDDADGLRVAAVLNSIPRVGETITRAILHHHGLTSTTTLGALSTARRSQLADFLLGEGTYTITDILNERLGRRRLESIADMAATYEMTVIRAPGRLVLVD